MAANRRGHVAINYATNGVVDKPTEPRRWTRRLRSGRSHQSGGVLKLIMDQNNSNVIGPKVTAMLIFRSVPGANPAPVIEDDVFPQPFED